MQNPVVQYFRSHLGKSITETIAPITVWLGGTIRQAGEGQLTIDFLVEPKMTNMYGIIHGGVISMIMDEMIGAAVYTLNIETEFVTVNLYVDFLTTAKAGDILTAKSQIIRQGNTIINGACEIFVGERLIARGSSNLVGTIIQKN